MIVCMLSRKLGEKRWTQRKLAQKTGIRPNTVNALYHGYARRVSLEHLNKICMALQCDLSDILTYIPDNENPT